MAQKVRWRLLIVLILIFGGLYLARNIWQPWFFGMVFPRQQKLEGIKLVVDVINGIAALVTLGYGTYQFLYSKPEKNSLDYPKILTETSPEKILTDYVSAKPEEITWLDRQIVTTSHLRNYQRIVLDGRMKSGKTREAAELIRRALGEQLLIPSRVYDITQGVRGFTSDAIQSALQRDLDIGARVLFFINDLPKQATSKQLESLTVYIKALEKCSPGYFIATARSDQLMSALDLKKWLDQNKVHLIEMKSLTNEQCGLLIDELANIHGIEIIGEAKQVLIERSDGTPYHLILTIKFLAEEINREVTKDRAASVISKSSREIWTEIQHELKRIEPATESLLEALAVFYHANVTPNYMIVLAYAAELERSKSRQLFPWNAKRRVGNAVRMVQQYGIYHQNPFVFPDVAVETLIPASDGLPRLERFMRRYRRFYHNRILWKFNPLADPQQQVLMGLATSYYFARDLNKAEELWKVALNASEPRGIIWYNLGVLLDDLGRKDEAEQAYRQALDADPKDAKAWSNLGVLLDSMGDYAGARPYYEQALAIFEALLPPEHEYIRIVRGNLEAVVKKLEGK